MAWQILAAGRWLKPSIKVKRKRVFLTFIPYLNMGVIVSSLSPIARVAESSLHCCARCRV